MYSEEHQRRLAVNESRFRDINEELERDVRRIAAADDDVIEFVCECARPECRESVELTLGEYEAVRRDDRQFVVVSGHHIHEVERVVANRGRYAVIRKIGPGAEEAEERGPR